VESLLAGVANVPQRFFPVIYSPEKVKQVVTMPQQSKQGVTGVQANPRKVRIKDEVVGAASVGDGLTRQYLLSAHDSLAIGETRRGRRMARQALARSMGARDVSLAGEAALVLSHAHVLDSRLSLAHDMSSRAFRLFRQDSNPVGQADALAIHSYSASALGFDSQALQAACDSMSLRTDAGSALAQSRGLNYLGLASCWSGDFGTTRGALEASMWFARQANDAATSFHPLVNLCFAEVLQVVDSDRNGQASPDLSELVRLVGLARAMAQNGQCAGFHKPTLEIGLLLLDFCSCFVASRWGRTEEADAFYLECLQRAAPFPRNSWVHAVLWWARVERSVAYGDIDASIASLQAMGQHARAGEHAQLHALSLTLAATLRAPLNQADSEHMALFFKPRADTAS
jgi:hypothetical protein